MERQKPRITSRFVLVLICTGNVETEVSLKTMFFRHFINNDSDQYSLLKLVSSVHRVCSCQFLNEFSIFSFYHRSKTNKRQNRRKLHLRRFRQLLPSRLRKSQRSRHQSWMNYLKLNQLWEKPSKVTSLFELNTENWILILSFELNPSQRSLDDVVSMLEKRLLSLKSVCQLCHSRVNAM